GTNGCASLNRRPHCRVSGTSATRHLCSTECTNADLGSRRPKSLETALKQTQQRIPQFDDRGNLVIMEICFRSNICEKSWVSLPGTRALLTEARTSDFAQQLLEARELRADFRCPACGHQVCSRSRDKIIAEILQVVRQPPKSVQRVCRETRVLRS